MDGASDDAASASSPDLSLDEIAGGFPERFPDFRCSVCNNDKFHIGQAPLDATLSGRILLDNRFPLPAGDISLVCANCGNTYRFVRQILTKLLQGE